MARVLVTGIAGQDGRILSDALVAEGSEVHGLVLESDLPFAKSFTDSITLHVGDLGQSESVASIVQK